MSAAKKDAEVQVGCGGCLSFIVFVFVVWALCFGVTLDGKHYGLSCSTESGVVVDR